MPNSARTSRALAATNASSAPPATYAIITSFTIRSSGSFICKAVICRVSAASQLRIVDNFNLGPSLVRGFAPKGLGPRDIGSGDPQGNPLGGTDIFRRQHGSAVPALRPAKGSRPSKGAVFADAGSLFGFTGRTNFSPNGICSAADLSLRRSHKEIALPSAPPRRLYEPPPARRSYGRRRLDRSVSTSPRPSPKTNTTRRSSSCSPAAPLSDKASPRLARQIFMRDAGPARMKERA